MTEQPPTRRTRPLLTGLAIAGVAAVMGVTKDRWMPSDTPPAATEQAPQPAAQPETAPAAANEPDRPAGDTALPNSLRRRNDHRTPP